MGLRFAAARAVSAVSTWGLKNVFHRPAANFPGKVALYVDPALIGHERAKLRCGSVAVVGTNGKTTVTNLLADVVERSGQSVVCNRTGANLDSGVATALLHAKAADWGVFESDELWLAKVLPQLRADYVLLLNLFRDQLDRCGEIDRIQDSIVGALSSSPQTVLVYNADDPLCAFVAERAAALPGRENTPSIAFGVRESMGLAQNTVTDATMCQRCSTMFEYDFRQYGQLGEYRCPHCGFSRPALDYEADDVHLAADGLAFTVVHGGSVASAGASDAAGAGASDAGATAVGGGDAGDVAVSGGDAADEDDASAAWTVHADYNGAYMVYNLLAVAIGAQLMGCTNEQMQVAVDSFDPQNGRLQSYDIGGREVLLNLAKNPTGFNQNLKIVAQDPSPKAVAFFINDKEADGHDVSWLWDIDFEELAESGELVVFAGGIRGNDMQVRLKYADLDAQVVKDADELLGLLAAMPREMNAYLIANYTALPGVKAALDAAAAVSADAASSVDPGCSDPDVVVPGADGNVSSLGQSCSHGSATGTSGSCGTRLVDAADGPGGPRREEEGAALVSAPGEWEVDAGRGAALASAPGAGEVDAGSDVPPVVIAHLFPDLLNLYGDGGNVRVLEQRLRWRGIPVEVRRVCHGDAVDLGEVDLVMMGGSPDREQRLASADVVAMRDQLRDYVEGDGPLLAICGSYQMLGREWLLDGEVVEGLGLVDMTTGRPGTSADRLIDNIVLRSPLAARPVVGYENHAGRTYLGEGVEPFGTVASSTGCGNNEGTKADGVRYRNVIGTYLHGPLLAKNPEVADALLTRALERWSTRTGNPAPALESLDDAAEIAANEALCARFGVR